MSEALEPVVNPTPDLGTARASLAEFISRQPRDGRIVGAHDVDADGVSAGVVWQVALQRLGFSSVTRFIPDQERNVWTPGNNRRIGEAKPDALFVLDLGSQERPVVPGVQTCFVDHHRPEGVPPSDTLVSAYAWDPIPTTSLLTWEIFSPLVDLSDLDWIAAVGLIGDLGERAPFALLEVAKKKYTAKYLKEATALVNATRRSSRPDPEAAAQALLTHSDPKSLVNATTPEVESLRQARAEVKAAMDEAKKAAPLFSGQVALIRLHSRCQIHPLIAQIWRTRLPNFIVIAANDGYLPDRVNFSARSRAGVNVLDFLRSTKIEEGEGNFGHGHDQASGGSLPPDRWNALLRQWGFPDTAGAK